VSVFEEGSSLFGMCSLTVLGKVMDTKRGWQICFCENKRKMSHEKVILNNITFCLIVLPLK